MATTPPKRGAKKHAPPKPAGYATGSGADSGLAFPTVTDSHGTEITRNYSGRVTSVVTQADREAAAKNTPDAKAAAAKAKADAAAAGQRADQLATLNQAYGHAWVNGQKVTVTGMAPDGSMTFDYAGSGAKPAANKYTAFSALNGLGANTQASAQFTMSVSPVLTNADNVDSMQMRGGQHPTAHYADGRQMLTVGQGVQQFLNMAVEHPDQYKKLLDQLKQAGYVNPKTPGGYGNDAAVGAATAMADLAQINSTAGGRNVTLDQFLANKAKDAVSTAKATVQKVNRSYQDPATLSLTAKQAAQAAIGRALTPEEEAKFEAQFRGKENAAFNAADAANANQAAAAATGGSAAGASMTVPDTTGEAAQYVTSAPFQQEAAGYSALEYTKAFQSFLSNGSL